MDDAPPEEMQPPAAGKKPYQAPRLETYGDMRTITQAVAMNTAADGAAHGSTKTA